MIVIVAARLNNNHLGSLCKLDFIK